MHEMHVAMPDQSHTETHKATSQLMADVGGGACTEAAALAKCFHQSHGGQQAFFLDSAVEHAALPREHSSLVAFRAVWLSRATCTELEEAVRKFEDSGAKTKRQGFQTAAGPIHVPALL